MSRPTEAEVLDLHYGAVVEGWAGQRVMVIGRSHWDNRLQVIVLAAEMSRPSMSAGTTRFGSHSSGYITTEPGNVLSVHASWAREIVETE
jgi:hypothetical protein